MSRLPSPATAFLVDKKGTVHGTHVFVNEKSPRRAVEHLNPAVRATTDGKYRYTLADPEGGDYLTQIEKLFKST